MATIVIKTIKPSGGDYTSLSAAEAGEQRDLVALNEIAVLECYSMSDTAAVTFAGWTTDATHYIRVYTPASERHAGEWDGTKYNLALTNAHILTTGQTSLYIKIEGIQFKETATATWSYRACFYTSYNAGHNLEFDRCIFYNVSNGGGQYTVGIELFTSTGAIDVKIQNCAFFRSGTGGLSRGIWNGDASAGTVYTYNNTFKNFDEGIRQDATNTHNVKNCGFANCTTPISGTVTEVTNSTITPTFISGKEFHLDSTDTTWKDAGTDLSADAGVINSLDIDGETRTGTWDIGADEFVAAGGGGINIAGFINSLSTTIPNPILNVNRNIIGSFSGLSSFSSTSSISREIVGTFSGLSSFSSTSSISREIVGNILGTSSMTSFLNIKFKLAGIINGLSSFNANLITQLILSGSIPGVSILNGVLTLSGGSAVSLAGIINALSIMSGSSDISYDIVGAINGLSNLDSSIILSYKLNGSFSGLSSFSSTTSIGRGISGSFSGLSSVLGNVNRDLGIVGNLDGLSTVAGLLNLNYLLSGNISGISSLSSLISVWREINGILNSSSTLGATISLAAFLELIGSILGTSSLSAIPNVLRNISGDIFSVTTLSSSPDLLSLISGNITAISTVTGMSFDVLLGLIGSLNGASDLSALIDLDYILSGNMNSISGGVGILINPSLIGPSKITVTYSKLDKIIFETSNLNNIKINI